MVPVRYSLIGPLGYSKYLTLVYRTLNSTAASTDLADHGILIFMICDLLESLLFL